MDLNDPRMTLIHRQIIQQKRFLRKIYQEWYADLAALLPVCKKPVLEIGSGAGFLEEYIPNLITSDILLNPWLSAVLDGQRLPFTDDALGAIVMNNVMHHLPQIRDFLTEAARCVKAGGLLVTIEPWVTWWSTIIYSKLHHEPFDPEAENWTIPLSRLLSGANSALPWIIFKRDRDLFERQFPQWKIQEISLKMPFRYLVSGGLSMRTLMPDWTFGFWRWLETSLSPWINKLAMFALIVLENKT